VGKLTKVPRETNKRNNDSLSLSLLPSSWNEKQNQKFIIIY